MVEFPQTSVLQQWMPCKNFWSLLLLLSSSTLIMPTCSSYKKARSLLSVSQLTTVMAYQAATQGENLRKGPWLGEEDKLLITFVTILGDRRWDYIARASGLKRSGKSCRLRWLNYLRPNIKHGDISNEEEQIILQLQQQWGNKWSRIAQRLPGRTDNEIKNYWRTHLRKKVDAQRGENIQSGTNNAEQSFSFQKVDFDVQKYETDEKKFVEDSSATGNTSFDALAFSNFGYTFSPYETRLLDWMTEMSSDESKMKHQEDSCFSYKARISDDVDVFDWTGSIWDVN